MDFKEIQEIIAKEGGKIIIVENDKPQLVVMSYSEYKGRVFESQITQKPAMEANPDKAPLPKEPEEGELTIDDLPL